MPTRTKPTVQVFRCNKDVVPVVVMDSVPRLGAPELWPSVGEYPCYDDALYQVMSTDEIRNTHIRRALALHAPGKSVLDIGTGAHLLWAREALRLGARRAIAVEGMKESYLHAKALLQVDAAASSIQLEHGMSTEIELAQKADVVVAEVIGSLGGAEGAAAILADARRRHLAPGGVVIPHQCVTRAAAASLRQLVDDSIAFSPDGFKYLQAVFAWHGSPFDVRLRIANPNRAGIVSNDEAVEVLEFNSAPKLADQKSARLIVERPGAIDGILLWMQLWCAADGPPLDALRMPTNWASIFMPLFEREIMAEPGDVLNLSFAWAVKDAQIYPDYDLRATLQTAKNGVHKGTWHSPHRGGAFRSHPIYRTLFPSAPADCIGRASPSHS